MAVPRKKKITKRQIQSLLSESAFSPSEKTPFTIVVQMENPDYAELKAIELITEARLWPGGTIYHDKIQQAIALLALARAQRGTLPS